MSSPFPSMRLYSPRSERLYLNEAELKRFLNAANKASRPIKLFAYTLAYTGVRLSEARVLRYGALQVEQRSLSVQTLKKRREGVVREVPLPVSLLSLFGEIDAHEDDLMWPHHGRPLPRNTAYRWIKRLMEEADITGPRACPKGLRHAYGVRAILSGVPLHLLQRWMGHSSMSTTAIYASVMGQDQLQIADRMW